MFFLLQLIIKLHKNGKFENIHFTPILAEGYSFMPILYKQFFKSIPNETSKTKIPTNKNKQTSFKTLQKKEAHLPLEIISKTCRQIHSVNGIGVACLESVERFNTGFIVRLAAATNP